VEKAVGGELQEEHQKGEHAQELLTCEDPRPFLVFQMQEIKKDSPIAACKARAKEATTIRMVTISRICPFSDQGTAVLSDRREGFFLPRIPSGSPSHPGYPPS
jgi:hypothetical protein